MLLSTTKDPIPTQTHCLNSITLDSAQSINLPIFNKIQNSQMGSLSSKTIRVATANYSGITFSPFEFYSDDSKELDELNHIFSTLFSQINPARPQLHAPLAELTNYNKLKDNDNRGKVLTGEFDWGINNIDKSMQRGRYCAQYREDAGIENGRMITMDKYFARWEFEFNKNVKYVKMDKPNRQKGELSIQQQQRVCQVFDFLVYKTFMEYCYQQVFKQQGPGNSTNANVTIDDRDTDDSKQTRTRRKYALMKYQQFQEKYHKKPYLKTDIKFSYIRQLYTKNDVVFLQDCSDQLINQIKNEGDITIIEQLGGGADCYILINPNGGGFHRLYDLNRFMEEQNEKLAQRPQLEPTFLFRRERFNYFDSSPAICLTDQFLMMSLHFSSRKAKKYCQLVAFMTHLLEINQQFQGKLKIIVGGDFNANIRSFTSEKDYLSEHQRDLQAHQKILQQFWRIFFLYPENIRSVTITTRKKRTLLQSQAKKALTQDENSRDFLLSNCQLQHGRLINNSTSLADNLPSAKHPFDHFFLSADVAKQ